MGTFFSAFLSAISSPSNPSKVEETGTENSLNQTQSGLSLSKRKSRPELLIHRPITSAADVIVHEFIWKYGGKEILLAGSFTNWSPSIQMVPVDQNREYWRALVELDPKTCWEFKFVVDGVWRCSLDLPTTTDSNGNTNNIIYPE
jgi:hypothetical protein